MGFLDGITDAIFGSEPKLQTFDSRAPRTPEGQALWDQLGGDFYNSNIKAQYARPDMSLNFGGASIPVMNPAARQRANYLAKYALGPAMQMESMRNGAIQGSMSQPTGGLVGSLAPALGMWGMGGFKGLEGLMGGGGAAASTVPDSTSSIWDSWNLY